MEYTRVTMLPNKIYSILIALTLAIFFYMIATVFLYVMKISCLHHGTGVIQYPTGNYDDTDGNIYTPVNMVGFC